MKLKKRFLCGCSMLLILLCFGAFALCAGAETASLQTGTAHGSYRDPELGSIEDSGGESSAALGESMVQNVVAGPAMLETAPSGKMYLSVRFGLMDQISQTGFSARYPNQTEWTAIQAEKTAETQDTADFRFAVTEKDLTLRAEFYVDAMGRSVIFYVTADGWSEGNTAGFAELGKSESSGKTDLTELGNVQGLVTGEGAAAGTETAAPQTAPTQEDAQKPGEMQLGGSVWFMLFCVNFSAVFLAGGCLMLLSRWIDARCGKRVTAPPPAEEEPEEEENMDLSLLLDDVDWKEPDDETAH